MILTTAIAKWLTSLPMVERGGWTLLHSIWEFALVAGVLCLALRLLGGASARIRYLAATFALALVFALPPVTFLIISKNPPATPRLATSFQVSAADSVHDRAQAESAGNELPESLEPPAPQARHFSIAMPALLGKAGASWAARIADRLSPAIPWLMLAWTLGVAALSFWNLGGWIATQRLRSVGISSVDPDLAERLSHLAGIAGLTRPVRIAKSTLVQIPVVIGFVRPLILVPISVLAGLPPAYLEAIFAHELAHIRRHDYLVNLFQVLAETLFFYHPATWWISAQIREERENCCDDIAAKICGDRRLYAEALVCVEELRPPATSLAIAATGRSGQMFNRIQRLVGFPRRPRHTGMASLAVALISLSVLLLPPGCSYVSTEQQKPPVGTVLHIEGQEPFTDHAATGDFFKELAGQRTFDGLSFEIDGSTVFYGLRDATGRKSLEGIQVGRQFDELHLIHYVKYAADRDGTPVARIRVNYADGSQFEFQILYGSQVRTYCRTLLEEDDQPANSDSKVIWRSPVADEGSSNRLFKSVLRNPFPAKPVKSLDVFPEIGRGCYCLVAATVAQSDPSRAVTAAVPPAKMPAGSQVESDDLAIRVFDHASGKPVADALIIASLYKGGSTEIVIPTDAAGTAHLKYPIDPDGDLEITIQKDGYAMKEAKWPRDVVPPEFTTDFEKGVSIGGVVRSELGKPVSSALMHLYLLAPNGDESRTPISARTDRNGRWSISGIAADDHNFSISVGHSNFVKMTFLPDGAPDGDGTGHRIDPADFFSNTAVLEMIPAAASPIVPVVPSSGTTAERVGLLRQNVDQAYYAYQQDPSVQKRWTAFVQIVHADLPQILDLIDADASFNALESLQWIVDGRLLDAGAGKVSPLWERPRVIALLQDRFVKDPKIARICWVIGSSWNPEEAAPAALFDAVAKQNPDRLARSYATYAAASFLMTRATNAELAENVPDDIRFGAGTTPAIRAQFDEVEAAGGSKALYAQAAERLRIITDQYADCPGDVSGSTPCGEIARGELDEIEHFTVGERAPGIAAPDIKGQPLKTSDYRGRIVVLSFWGAWSGPSMQMMPMERRLAARTAGKPVALIGVNSDGDADMALAVAAREGMAWPSFWDGNLGPGGPISKAWHVNNWPTVYVLDGDGVIRFKFSGYGGGPTERILNAVVDRLIASGHS